MKIAFVNSNKSLPNIDALVSDYKLQIGDVLIVCSKLSLRFTIVDIDIKMYGVDKLKLLENCELKRHCDFSTNLVFNYDGVSERCGDVAILNFLLNEFLNDGIRIFLLKAIEILGFKADRFEAIDLIGIFNAPECCFPINNDGDYLFIKCFSERLKRAYDDLIAKGFQTKDAYVELKRIDADAFSEAIKLFRKSFPDNTIYDKEPKPLIYDNSAPNDAIHYARCSGFQKIYKTLEEKNMCQISDTEWIDQLGNVYVVDIHKKIL